MDHLSYGVKIQLDDDWGINDCINLLKEGKSINLGLSKTEGFLHEAINDNDLKLLNFAIQNKAKCTKYHLARAVELNREDMIKILIEKVTPNKEIYKQLAINNRIDIIKIFNERGYSVSLYCHVLMREACKNGHYDLIKYLLEKDAIMNNAAADELLKFNDEKLISLVPYLHFKGDHLLRKAIINKYDNIISYIISNSQFKGKINCVLATLINFGYWDYFDKIIVIDDIYCTNDIIKQLCWEKNVNDKTKERLHKVIAKLIDKSEPYIINGVIISGNLIMLDYIFTVYPQNDYDKYIDDIITYCSKNIDNMKIIFEKYHNLDVNKVFNLTLKHNIKSLDCIKFLVEEKSVHISEENLIFTSFYPDVFDYLLEKSNSKVNIKMFLRVATRWIKEDDSSMKNILEKINYDVSLIKEALVSYNKEYRNKYNDLDYVFINLKKFYPDMMSYDEWIEFLRTNNFHPHRIEWFKHFLYQDYNIKHNIHLQNWIQENKIESDFTIREIKNCDSFKKILSWYRKEDLIMAIIESAS